MTEVLKAHQHDLVKDRQEERTDDLVDTARKEVDKGEVHVIVGMFPNVQIFKAPGGWKFGDKCLYKDTAKLADEKNNPASIAIHIPSNDERQMHVPFTLVGGAAFQTSITIVNI